MIRIKRWVLPALTGCEVLLLWLALEQMKAPRTHTAGRERGAPPQPPPSPPPEDIFPTAGNGNGNGHSRSREMTEEVTAETDKSDVANEPEEWPEVVEAFKPLQPSPPQPSNPVNRATIPGRAPPMQAAVRPPFVERNARKESDTLASKLPRNTPAWFKEYDANGDGLVALHEWKARENGVREFHKYDLNGDGFISVEELVRTGQFATNMPTPVVLAGQGTEIGQFYFFELTGSTQGGVWGTDVYTTDSPMATAAVHAGVLRPGEKGYVKVTVLPGQQHYFGSVANGVTTHDHYAGFHKSFRVEAIR